MIKFKSAERKAGEMGGRVKINRYQVRKLITSNQTVTSFSRFNLVL